MEMVTNREQILAKIAELEAKHRAAKQPEAKYYYAMCLAGWRRMLIKSA